MSDEHQLDLICLGRAAVDLYGEQIGSPLEDIQSAWGDIPTCPAIAMQGVGVVETFRCLLRALYTSLDEKHDFSAKFGVSQGDFLKGVLHTFSEETLDAEDTLSGL